MVPRAQLTAAAAIMSLSTNASVLVGSSLGGVLAVAPGPWLVYALDAAGFAVSFVHAEQAAEAAASSGSDTCRARAARRCGRSWSACGTRSAAGTCSAPTWPTCPR